jgi:hypothetical protein
VDWEQKASDVVGYVRMDAGRHPDDPRLSALVGALSVKSPEFRRLWAAHDVKAKGNGTKNMRHPLVGDLTLSFETFLLADDSDQALITHHGSCRAGIAVRGGPAAARELGCGRHAGRLGHVGPVRLTEPHTGRVSAWDTR